MNLKTSAIFTGLILLSALSMSVAQTVNPLVHTPNGYVYDLDAKGDTLIVVGRFGHVGKPTGGIAQVTSRPLKNNQSIGYQLIK